MRYHFVTTYILDNRQRRVDCQASIQFANSVARKALDAGATEVTIHVTKDNGKEDEYDDSWPPLNVEVLN